ncbi:MAG TPA: hypothetical protein VEL76_34595 [Gemmataceae bacterium]|nr:hypothetical protein [Gemmataceae bacterium]
MSIAPMAFQPAAVSAPVSLSSLSVAGPVSLQGLSLNVQPTAMTTATPLVLNVTQGRAPSTAATPQDTGMDCGEAIKRLSKSVETLTTLVEKHTDILASHETRLQQLKMKVDELDQRFPAKKKGEGE